MKNKFLKLSAFVFATIALASCLKDKAFDDGTRGNEYDAAQQKVVSIELNTVDTVNFGLAAFQAASTMQTLNLVPVRLAGGVVAPQDVHVVLALDNSLVTTYNTANGTSYTAPPPASYTIPTLTVTIPKGQTDGFIQISLIPTAFLGTTPALGFRIVSVDGGYQVAAGYKARGVAAFLIINAYAGDYLSISDRTRYNGATVASGVLDHFYNLAPGVLKTYNTSGATSISGGLGDAGSGVAVDLRLNTATNVVDVIATSGTLAADLNTNISTGSTYDPATKTYHISAAYHATSGNLRTVTETIVKQ